MRFDSNPSRQPAHQRARTALYRAGSREVDVPEGMPCRAHEFDPRDDDRLKIMTGDSVNAPNKCASRRNVRSALHDSLLDHLPEIVALGEYHPRPLPMAHAA